MKLANRIVMITGASGGLGRAMAVEASRRGARGIALLARREHALSQTASQLHAMGTEALALPTDVQDEHAVQSAVEQTLSRWGQVDVAIANAGIGISQSALNADTVAFRQTLETNLFGAIHLFHAVLPAMLARERGHLVGISSIAGYRGLPGSASYSVSKAALSTLMESYGHELPAQGVLTTCIEPGFIQTEMVEENDVPMPFMLSAEEGARRILKAVEDERRRHAFPWPTALGMRALRLLPDAVFAQLARVLISRSKRGQPDSD